MSTDNVLSFPTAPSTSTETSLTETLPPAEPGTVTDFAYARRRQRILDVAEEQWGVYESIRIPHDAPVIEHEDGSVTVTVQIHLGAFLFVDK